MTRRHCTFPCEGEMLAGTVVEAASPAAPAKTGVLIVSGGNETRAGAFSGQAYLAQRLADAGHAVFRFDRRGVGDSSGVNAGFQDSGADIEAALMAFRRECPAVQRIAAFGNCDAASALLLGAAYGCDALVLANPWTFDEAKDDSTPPAAIRQRYAAKLKDPREVFRLLRGGVSIKKLAAGLLKAARPAPPASSLARKMEQAILAHAGPLHVLLAENDRTAQAFMAACPATAPKWRKCEASGHSFAEAHAREWLYVQLLAALDEQARQLDMG